MFISKSLEIDDYKGETFYRWLSESMTAEDMKQRIKELDEMSSETDRNGMTRKQKADIHREIRTEIYRSAAEAVQKLRAKHNIKPEDITEDEYDRMDLATWHFMEAVYMMTVNQLGKQKERK